MLGFVCSISALGQNRTTLTMEDIPAACEQNAVYLEQFNIERLNKKETGFVIIRAGDGEGSKILNHRFNMVSKYLKRFIGKDLIYARGEPVKGKGRVELYMGSVLFLVMFAEKGRVPCMNCCGYDFQRGHLLMN